MSGPQENCPAVEIRNVTKQFGSFIALSDVSVSIRDKEFFTLLGPSGCGKTTLLRLIAGFEDVTGGEVLLYGEDIARLPPNRRPVNTVFQHYALFPHMTVRENIGFGLKMRGITGQDAENRVNRMLDLVHLEALAERRPNQLSGGQQQRSALARAIAPGPKVLLLDEPLSALDLKLRQAMRLELKRLQQETGITFVFVTHDQEEALAMSDRIAVMSEGIVQQTGTARDIYDRPVNRFVANFIGETNLLDVEIDRRDGSVDCRLANGEIVEVESVPAGIGSTARAQLLIRPERIELLPPQAGSMRGRIIEAVYLGTDMQYLVLLRGDIRITARSQNSDAAKPQFSTGDEVAVLLGDGAARLLLH
ncbi:MAG: ABC transporter ATP-binding protein [Rhodobacteraceae bacterium]|nr:ABC transporter ATP-binding protein [Paracoccaceae bacterium]